MSVPKGPSTLASVTCRKRLGCRDMNEETSLPGADPNPALLCPRLTGHMRGGCGMVVV